MKQINLKNVCLIITTLFVAIEAYADKTVVMDHAKKTITVSANFVTFSPIESSLQEAVDLWNAQSGLYTSTVKVKGEKINYKVVFNICVNKPADGNLAFNVVSVIPDAYDTRISQDVNGDAVTEYMPGYTDGKAIVVKEGFKKDIYVLTHQIGHNLGFKHSRGFLLDTNDASNFAGFDIRNSFKKMKVKS